MPVNYPEWTQVIQPVKQCMGGCSKIFGTSQPHSGELITKIKGFALWPEDLQAKEEVVHEKLPDLA